MPTTNPVDPIELHKQIQDFRKRIADGQEVSDDELRTALIALRAYRSAAHTNVEKAARDKGKKAAASTAKAEEKQKAIDLLGGLLDG